MKDTTFVIHTRIDCQERQANLDFCIAFLQSNFKTNIIIVEQDTRPICHHFPNVEHLFIQSDDKLFNRTKLVNAGAKLVTTPYICLLDMDIFLDPWYYIQAEYFLKDYSLVYPFDGRFYDIPQSYNKISNLRMKDVANHDKVLLNTDSVGGLQFVRTKDFFDAGMTNEFIKGWGYEDNEFFARFTNLGYKIKRLDCSIYHFKHPRTFNSDGRSPYIHQNQVIYESVKAMSPEETRGYIKTFTWL